jgi:hypothetical protein
LRDVDDLRIGRLNHIDRLPPRLLQGHGLLLIAAQRARRVSLSSQALNGICDRCLIGRESVADCGVVVNMLRHHVEDLREIYERNECGVETLLLRRIGEGCSRQAGICRQPIVNVQNLLRVGCGRHHLRQQRVRIERYRRHQLIQLLGSESCRLCGQQRLESL